MALLGIDASEDRPDCAVLADEGGRPLGRRAFPNDAGGTERAAIWAARVSGAAPADTHVILEATAAYHEPVARRLVALGTRVSIVNPAQVRSFAKGLGILGKTDRVDARLLARYGQLVRPKAWRPPAEAVADLQALVARLDDVEADLRREESRLEQARTRGCPGIVEWSLLESVAALKSRRQGLRRAIVAHVAAHGELQADFERLLTIPAVGPKTAVRMMAMLRARGFDSARQAAAYLGLVPIERQSGKSVRGRPRLSRAGNPRLRAALYMAAVVGIRRNPDIKLQYERLLKAGKCCCQKVPSQLTVTALSRSCTRPCVLRRKITITGCLAARARALSCTDLDRGIRPTPQHRPTQPRPYQQQAVAHALCWPAALSAPVGGPAAAPAPRRPA
jgi:transposase